MTAATLAIPDVAALVRADYADHALALDFRRGVYRSGTTLSTSVAALPGYGFVRAGTQTETGADGVPISFAAGVPAIVPGIGYWVRAAGAQPGDTLLTLNQPIPGDEDFVIYVVANFPDAATSNNFLLSFDDGTINNRFLVFRRSDGELRGFTLGGAVPSDLSQAGAGRAAIAFRHRGASWTAGGRDAAGTVMLGAEAARVYPVGLNAIRIGYAMNGVPEFITTAAIEKIGLIRATYSDSELIALLSRA